MSTRQKLIFMSCLMLVLLIVGSVFGWKETEISKYVPLPKKIQIIQPTGDLPKEIAAFSGRWEGKWDSRDMPAILIVEKIDSKKAEGINAWGGDFVAKGDYDRFKAKVMAVPKPKIEFFTARCKYQFVMGEDLKSINGVRECQGFPSSNITMEKIEED